MESKNVSVVRREDCCGCGACFNKCPVDAISMKENDEGFLFPVVDESKCTNCGLCQKSCPILHPKSSNFLNPKCYAVMAPDFIRSKSSSGGMFTLVADYILEQGGYVCGAAYNSNWSVSHVIINNKDELDKLRGSKYFQSDINSCFRQIGKLLKENKKVLFTGCPCQVAGLYGYIGSDSDNLITMELLCHGTPSYKIFKKYLDENHSDKNIERIEFRDKTLNWSCVNLAIYHDKGKKTVLNVKDDSFEKGFHKSLFNRESCAPCKFAHLPRQADITIADWWGIHAIDSTFDDKKGTSLVLLNNQKAEDVYNVVKKDMQKQRSIPLKLAKKSVNKTICKPLKAHKGRYNFFRNLDSVSINKNVHSSLTDTYDVGILGLWKGNNYGCILTGYALYRVVQDLGYSTAFIEKINNKNTAQMNNMVNRFSKNINIISVDHSSTHILNDKFSTFLVGSDQVWNYSLCLQWNKFFLLDFATSNKLKLSYASSIGNNFDTLKSKEDKLMCKYLLNKFDNISVREDYAVKILKEVFNIDSIQVLDPVFVCNPNYYYNLADKSKIETDEDYIFAYILDPTPEKNKILEYAATQLGKKLYVATDATDNNIKKQLITAGYVLGELDLEDWLRFYRDAKYIVTDSFHGTCFSIIFNKEFISMGNIERGIRRFESLLSGLELQDRLFESFEDLKYRDLLNKKINYERTNKILTQKKEYSLNWLLNSLKIQKENALTDYDVCRRLITIYSHSKDYYKRRYRLYNFLYKITAGRLRKRNREKMKYWEAKLVQYKKYKTFLLNK